MKKLLIATTALVATTIAAGQAFAADKVKISLGGYMNALIHNTSQDTTGFAQSSLREVGFLTEGEIHFKGKTTLDNGMEVGIRVELEIEADNSSGGQSANNDIIDELYMYAQGGWGRLEFGQQDGIADQFGVPPPRYFRAAAIDDPEVFFVQDGSENPYRPNSLRLRTDNFVSDDNVKIIYMTPRWSGLQLGISYMPEQTKNFTGFATRRDNNPDQQSEILEVGANFDESFDDVKLKAYVVYLTGSNEAPTDITSTLASPWTSDDLEEWGAGATVTFSGFSLGVAYRESNARGGSSLTTVLTDGSDTDILSIGATYTTGPWTFGAAYITGDTEATTTVAGVGTVFEQEGDAFEVGVNYEISTGINVALGYQNYAYENNSPTIAVQTANTGTLDSDTLFLGWNIEM